MPIYEFKCSKCETFFEQLIMNSSDEKTVQCPQCESGAFERVLSSTNFNMAAGSSAKTGASQTTRSCSGGNCTTYTLPGPNG